MAPLRLTPEESALLRAHVLVQRYSLGLNQVAERALDDLGSDNADIELLLTIWAADGVSPSEVVATLNRPRSTVSRGLARLLSTGLVERRTQEADRRRAELHLTAQGRAAVTRFERSLTDYFVATEPLVKEVLLVLGRDPERGGAGDAPRGVLELAGRLSAAGAAWSADIVPRLRPFGAHEPVDRYALMVLSQAWARPSWLADELWLSPAGTTSLVERLEAAGLVVRETKALESDRRAVVVRLTPRGRRAARLQLEVFSAHRERVLDALAATIGRR